MLGNIVFSTFIRIFPTFCREVPIGRNKEGGVKVGRGESMGAFPRTMVLCRNQHTFLDFCVIKGASDV